METDLKKEELEDMQLALSELIDRNSELEKLVSGLLYAVTSHDAMLDTILESLLY